MDSMILKVSSNISDSMISSLALLSGQWFNALSSSFLSCAPSPGTDTSAPSAALCPPNLCSFLEHWTSPPLCSLGLEGCSWMRASSSGSENHTTPEVESIALQAWLKAASSGGGYSGPCLLGCGTPPKMETLQHSLGNRFPSFITTVCGSTCIPTPVHCLWCHPFL